MAPFTRAMEVSYRLSIVTVALSLTIRPQFVIECLRRSNQNLWCKICGGRGSLMYVRLLCVILQAEVLLSVL